MPDLLLGGIAINEVLVDPNGANNFDTDGSGVARGGDEFLELINTSGSAIDISGLELWDAGRDNWFTFPPGTVLEAGAVAVVVRNVQSGGSLPSVTGNNLAFDANYNSNVFNNSADNLVVYDPANDEFIQATYNGDTLDDPTTGSRYAGFSSTATRVGSGENFGNDQDGFSIQRGGSSFTNNSTPTPGSQNVCFATGTMLETPQGFTGIEHLRAGDLVNTRDNGVQPIRWIFARRVSAAELKSDTKLAPICIDAKALGLGVEQRPLRVSRQHRLLVTGKIAQRMFGHDELLVPAKDLLGCDGVTVEQPDEDFYYFHVLLDDHHVLNANGVAAESLFLGSESLSAISIAAREELEILLPKTIGEAAERQLRSARTLRSGARARHMIHRYVKNHKTPLVAF
ncbi:lamin tail-like protein [Litoreibacter meonggei]|uniref:Lamin tail-like protein n=1 Tax=Litoreibacter meonggei TaxID=1049199 RepID=A0A497WSW8_9RHOB|nr:Hint domain-containing protein [Litoreibacter meonggei]RLJ52083.1 lamin tail-like protein [Litoreibacter meonggei]